MNIDLKNFIIINGFRFRLEMIDGWQSLKSMDDEGNNICFTRVFYKGYTVDVVDKDNTLCSFLDTHKNAVEVAK